MMNLGGIGNAENWQPVDRVLIAAEELRPGDLVLYPGAGDPYAHPILLDHVVFDTASDAVELWPGPWRIRRSTRVWVDPNRPLPVVPEAKRLGPKKTKRPRGVDT